ncbi:MAG: D-Ala-D-Ala carboxypeptidase family metallohydrolase [Gemmatimonadaceae bacterium]
MEELDVGNSGARASGVGASGVGGPASSRGRIALRLPFRVRDHLVNIASVTIALVTVAGFAISRRVAAEEEGRPTLTDVFSVDLHEGDGVGASGTLASADAFGASGQVRMRFALPRRELEFPLQVSGDPGNMRYQWVPYTGGPAIDGPQVMRGAQVIAPARPGFYRLAVLRGAGGGETGSREVLAEPVVAVMAPFEQKRGTMLNGYRIGTYIAERFGIERDLPDGFLEVRPGDLALHVSEHLRVEDFVTHDEQAAVWPKYVALHPKLLDKLELVIGRVERMRGFRQGASRAELGIDVHSGFRTPAHNAAVKWAARDSRHQQGDAADIVIDADGDGRITVSDMHLVAAAVEAVEREHPDLTGGLGLYASRRYRTPYVHIDARGTRSRWRG